MKKLLFIFITTVICIGIAFLIVNRIEEDNPLYTNITLSKYKENINKKEDFTVYIYSNSCGACRKFKPILNEWISNNNKEILALDVGDSNNNDTSFLKEQGIQYTPTLIKYTSGIVAKSEVGVLSLSEINQIIE